MPRAEVGVPYRHRQGRVPQDTLQCQDVPAIHHGNRGLTPFFGRLELSAGGAEKTTHLARGVAGGRRRAPGVELPLHAPLWCYTYLEARHFPIRRMSGQKGIFKAKSHYVPL